MPPDDHENRISRLEIRMEMVSEQQHRADEERREQYSEIIRELKALRAEHNRTQGARDQRASNLKIAGVVIGIAGLFVALGWLGTAESREALKRDKDDESERVELAEESPRTSEPFRMAGRRVAAHDGDRDHCDVGFARVYRRADDPESG